MSLLDVAVVVHFQLNNINKLSFSELKIYMKNKNYSARKLLLMLVNGEHTSYCKRRDLPATDCLCLRHEIKQWQERIAASAKNRVGKAAKPKKVHLDGLKCARKANAVTSTNLQEVTCGHCLKLARRKGIASIVSQSLPNFVTASPGVLTNN